MRGAWLCVLPVVLAADLFAQAAPVPHYNPAAAGLFSALIVGGGQAYNGQWEKGAAFLGVAVLGGVGFARARTSDEDACDRRTAQHFGAGGAGTVTCAYTASNALLGGLVAWWTYGLVDAVRTARGLNAEVVVAPMLDRSGQVGLRVSLPAP